VATSQWKRSHFVLPLFSIAGYMQLLMREFASFYEIFSRVYGLLCSQYRGSKATDSLSSQPSLDHCQDLSCIIKVSWKYHPNSSGNTESFSKLLGQFPVSTNHHLHQRSLLVLGTCALLCFSLTNLNHHLSQNVKPKS
jgi:hypothetical protein